MTTHNTPAPPADVSATESPSVTHDAASGDHPPQGTSSHSGTDNGSGTAQAPPKDAEGMSDSSEQTSDAPAADVNQETDAGTTAGSSPPDATAISDESTQPVEKARRRVQLSPTVSPEHARPVPSIATPIPPDATSDAASASPPPASDQPAASQAASDQEPATTEPPAAAEAAEDTATSETPSQPVTGSEPTPPPAQPIDLPPRSEPLDSDIEAQLDAALSGGMEESSPVAEGDLAAAQASAVPADEQVKRGARLSGTVQSIHGDDMFIDFGLRMAGVLSRRQFGLRRQPMQGESITVIVNRIDEKEGLISVNLPTGASRVRGNWEELSVDQIVECMVNSTNKGGLEVSVGSLRGFMPASQVELGFVADLNVYVGQKFRAQITEVNPRRRKLVLSRRKLLEVEREQTEQEIFGKIAPGQTYEGRVKTIKDYGAFVDIGGVDGLLHVGQISWSRINHPSDILTEGQQIEVKVLSVDSEKKKIGLGMRQLSQNPWKTAEQKFPSGTVATGKVTRIEGFGAFIELEPGIEGLVHISELDHQRIKTVHEVLRVSQEVNVQVLEVDPSRKRISLSVKALKEKPEETRQPEDQAAPVKRQDPESLKGGIGEPTGGQLFGDPRRFGR